MIRADLVSIMYHSCILYPTIIDRCELAINSRISECLPCTAIKGPQGSYVCQIHMWS